jgi:hypothetical protein
MKWIYLLGHERNKVCFFYHAAVGEICGRSWLCLTVQLNEWTCHSPSGTDLEESVESLAKPVAPAQV